MSCHVTVGLREDVTFLWGLHEVIRLPLTSVFLLSLPSPPLPHTDTIDKWDEDKLKEVVQQKHGEKSRPKTDIVRFYTYSTFNNMYTHTHVYPIQALDCV